MGLAQTDLTRRPEIGETYRRYLGGDLVKVVKPTETDLEFRDADDVFYEDAKQIGNSLPVAVFNTTFSRVPKNKDVEQKCADEGCTETWHVDYVTEFERRELETTPWHCWEKYLPDQNIESAWRRHIRCALAQAGAVDPGKLADAVLTAIGPEIDELEYVYLQYAP